MVTKRANPFMSLVWRALANCHAHTLDAPMYRTFPWLTRSVSVECLLDGRLVVPPVDLVEINVIGLQPPE